MSIDTARKLIETAGAKLLVYCPAARIQRLCERRAAGELAAALRDGLPSWLTPVGDQSSSVRKFWPFDKCRPALGAPGFSLQARYSPAAGSSAAAAYAQPLPWL